MIYYQLSQKLKLMGIGEFTLHLFCCKMFFWWKHFLFRCLVELLKMLWKSILVFGCVPKNVPEKIKITPKIKIKLHIENGSENHTQKRYEKSHASIWKSQRWQRKSQRWQPPWDPPVRKPNTHKVDAREFTMNPTTHCRQTLLSRKA